MEDWYLIFFQIIYALQRCAFFLFIFIFVIVDYENIKFKEGPSWSWSYGSWIYNYLCNQCRSPIKLWVRTRLMVRCTRYNIMW